MSGTEPAPQSTPRPRPDLSPAAVLEVMSLFVSSLPDRIGEWSPAYLMELHGLCLQADRMAAEALSRRGRSHL